MIYIERFVGRGRKIIPNVINVENYLRRANIQTLTAAHRVVREFYYCST